jgi:quercetin dioxygenase-like cupin family protein
MDLALQPDLLFLGADEGEWTDLGAGAKRRVRVSLPELMMVEFAFEKGAVGPPHSHPHIQCSYVEEGRFEVSVGGHSRQLAQGGSFIVPPDVTHGVVALEKGRLVDVFTPRRDDFLA